MDLETGQIIHARNFTEIVPMPKGQVGISSLSYKAPKGMLFSLILMGCVPNDGSKPINADDWLKAKGWTPPSDKPKDEPKTSSKPKKSGGRSKASAVE